MILLINAILWSIFGSVVAQLLLHVAVALGDILACTPVLLGACEAAHMLRRHRLPRGHAAQGVVGESLLHVDTLILSYSSIISIKYRMNIIKTNENTIYKIHIVFLLFFMFISSFANIDCICKYLFLRRK